MDPAMQTFEQQTVPAIQQRFVDEGGGSSSALNQALAQSASDLSTMIGSKEGEFQFGQQQLQQGGMQNILQLLAQMSSQRTFDPMIQQRQGLLPPLIGGVGAGLTLGAGGK